MTISEITLEQLKEATLSLVLTMGVHSLLGNPRIRAVIEEEFSNEILDRIFKENGGRTYESWE